MGAPVPEEGGVEEEVVVEARRRASKTSRVLLSRSENCRGVRSGARLLVAES